MKMVMALETYGKSPAALYLVNYLNEKNDPILNKKIGRTISMYQSMLSDLVKAHQSGNMSLKNFSRMVNLLSENATDDVGSLNNFLTSMTSMFQELEETENPIPDLNHAWMLALNVIQGNIKTWKRRISDGYSQEKAIKRTTKPGTTIPKVTCPMESQNEKTPEQLQEKSRKYLERHGKINTLYPRVTTVDIEITDLM